MPSPAVFRFDVFELDEHLFELRRNAKLVAIQRRPFDLLLHLVKRRDVVVSKQELLECVWSGAYVTDDALARAVMAVRTALGEDVSKPRFISTVRGRGYRFTEPVEVVSSAGPPSSAPFVGRTTQLAVIRERLERAIGGHGGVVLITGDAGAGKTRLLAQLEKMSSESGRVVLAAARCSSAEGAPPLWLVAQILEELRRGGEPVDRALDTVGSSGALDHDLAVADARHRLFERILAALAAAASRRPLVLSVDDLHLVDGASLALLEQLGPRLGKLPILLACAHRAVATHPALRAALGALGRDASTRVLTLEPLSRLEVAEYLERTMEQPADSVLEKVYDKTLGNPLLVKELAGVFQSAKQLRAGEASTSALVGGDAMREAIVHHLRTLPEAVIRVLTAASVFGNAFSLAPLAAAAGVPNDATLRELDVAEAAHIVRREGAGVYSFTYPLVRDTLYKRLAVSERVGLHAAAAAALAGQLGDGGDHRRVAEVAYQFIEAAPLGEVENAVLWSVRASSLARAAGDHATSLRYAARAQRALPFAQSGAEEMRRRLLDACDEEDFDAAPKTQRSHSGR
jgi:predicted ATPase